MPNSTITHTGPITQARGAGAAAYDTAARAAPDERGHDFNLFPWMATNTGVLTSRHTIANALGMGR